MQYEQKNISDQTIQDVLTYIDEHYQEPLNLKMLSERAFMSESTFSRWFKKSTGKKFVDYVRSVRLEKARERLLSTGKSITKVAYECGFSNLSVFNKNFHEKFGAVSYTHLNNNVFLLTISAIIGFGNSAANVSTGMLSDCIEYGDWKYGIREEGLTYSYMSFGVKLATAVGGSATVLLLAATGYVPNAEQTEAVKTGINAIVNLFPTICIIISMIPLFWYKLDKKMMDKIRVELDERNAKNA